MGTDARDRGVPMAAAARDGHVARRGMMRGLSRAWALATGVALIIALGCIPQPAVAKGGSFSRGGYSRPSGFGSRTPSSGGWSSSRTPSTSGGYSRPAPSYSRSSGGFPSGSATDQALARQSSRDALGAYRQSQSPGTYTRRPATEPLGSWDGVPRRNPWSAPTVARDRWQRSLSWQAPAYVSQSQPSFGPWNALFLWGLLNSLDRPGHTEFFHNHEDDPGYRAWRAEAETRAKDDPAVQRQLAELDNRLQTMQGQPRVREYLPPDASPQIAYAERDEGGGKITLFLLLIVCAGVAYLGWRSLSGDIAARKKPMLGKLFESSPYRPKWFRIGMTLPVDPSLFILASQCTHIRPPDQLTSSGLISVECLGQVQSGEIVWHRLYPQGENCFFQVHLDRHGHPDECRYFSKLDEVNPATQEEWAFWLDESEGQIGWPEFQTKDGKLYRRVASPGGGRVAPHRQEETLIADSGENRRSHTAMLYGAATGAAAPAPQTEYLLVTAIDDGARAWVALYAGVDVSVSSLNLS